MRAQPAASHFVDGRPLEDETGAPIPVIYYGPYVKWGKVNATIPKGIEPEAITLEEALALVAEKAGKAPKKKAPARKAKAEEGAPKKAAPKKAAAKTTKTAAKKPAAAKSTAKKKAAPDTDAA